MVVLYEVKIKIIPSFPVKNLRKILIPFSLGYKGVMALRNHAYDQQWFMSKRFDLPTIGVGNLSTGGTGKSPMTEYIIRLLINEYKLATLSRGYGRATTGYFEVRVTSLAKEVGDEPLQFKQKFPEITVAVDENRIRGIQKIQQQEHAIDAIVLDDIYQHRKIQPGFLILLTSYDSPFYEDLVLPAGNLRESGQGAQRADVVVVTKCPAELDRVIQEKMIDKIKKYTAAPVYFSNIIYDEVASGIENRALADFKNGSFTVVTGIAKPQLFVKHLKKNGLHFNERHFPDHHNFTEGEIKILDEIPVILTTEKDYVRLKPQLKKAKLYYLPIQFSFLNKGSEFDHRILNYMYQNSSAQKS